PPFPGLARLIIRGKLDRPAVLSEPIPLPDPGPLDEDPPRLEGAQDEAVPPVQEPALHDVHAEEAPERTEEELDGPGAAALPEGVGGPPGRVPMELLEVVRERAAREVRHRREQ